jgi:hypothetical protein
LFLRWEQQFRFATIASQRFFKLFPNSAFISELVRATFRCATGNEHQARGEDAYYCQKVRDAHPVEFAELRAEWSERLSDAKKGWDFSFDGELSISFLQKGSCALLNEETAGALFAISIFLSDRPDVILQIIEIHIVSGSHLVGHCLERLPFAISLGVLMTET